MAKDKIGIYMILNKVNGKRYIGSSKNVRKRKNRHFSELRRDVHKNRKLQNSFNKYGEDKFEFKLLEEVSDEKDLIVREQVFINELKPKLNINLIANSSLGVKRSEETKEKVRQANLGLKHPEWRNKIKSEAQGGDNHWTKSKSFSDEAKENMSNTHKELYKNGYVNPRKGVKESEEIINRKRIISAKPIQMFDLEGNMVGEFGSAKEAHEQCGFSPQYIGQCCNGKREKYKGYVWKFK